MIGTDKLTDTNNEKPHIQGPETESDKKAAIQALNSYNKSYRDARRQGKGFNNEIIDQLADAFRQRGLEMPELPDDILCPVTQTIFNIPVKVTSIIPVQGGTPEKHEHYFDFSTLVKYNKANEATFKSQNIFCTHPLNRLPIRASDLQPAPEMQEKINSYIESMKAQLRNTPAPAASSTSQKIKK
tara:strand:+ start:101294 stop:101848 length:555 start_codon:yes stop_codon:yes gene_type:complete